MYERESTAKHGTARHRTALRRAVELAMLNGAGDTAVRFFVLSDIHKQLGVTRKKNLSPHLVKAIRCAHVLP